MVNYDKIIFITEEVISFNYESSFNQILLHTFAQSKRGS
jgi:hypothetical protein